jgi:hypothetical protein
LAVEELIPTATLASGTTQAPLLALHTWLEAANAPVMVDARTLSREEASAQILKFPEAPSSTNAIPTTIVARTYAQQSLLNEIDRSFARGVEAARSKRYREAFKGILHALDLLMKSAMWDRISAKLDQLCSEDIPVFAGVGALRFTAEISDRLGNWDRVLGKLVDVAEHQGVDVASEFRGLMKSNGAKRRI